MNLEQRLVEDLKSSMKEKNKVRLSTLRAIKGAYQLEAINQKLEVNDDLILSVIQKQIKMRKDSIEEFTRCNRIDLKESYEEEVKILEEYMPKKLTAEELDEIINKVFLEVKPSSIKDLGSIMKMITPLVKNRCDMKELNQMIRERL